MTVIIILILVAVLLFGAGGAAVVYFVYRRARSAPVAQPKAKPAAPPKPAETIKPIKAPVRKPLTFRWSYAALPLLTLLISIILAAVFFPRLPAEVGYRFSDGIPSHIASRQAVVAVALVIQLFFALLAVAIAWGVTKSRILSQSESTWADPRRLLWFMGNMVALPQLIFAFAMADIFSYNSFQAHLIPIWIFALVVMGVGGIVLGGMFIMTVLRVFSSKVKS